MVKYAHVLCQSASDRGLYENKDEIRDANKQKIDENNSMCRISKAFCSFQESPFFVPAESCQVNFQQPLSISPSVRMASAGIRVSFLDPLRAQVERNSVLPCTQVAFSVHTYSQPVLISTPCQEGIHQCHMICG
jgi:hypothetical protein